MIEEARILIVEDLPTDAELAMRELQKSQISFKAKRVDTKEDFLKALTEFKPDIILSDYSLPNFNALDALRLLKTHNNDTPFILYTGSLTEEVAVECMKEGVADYILKSSLKRLPSAILNVLEKREVHNIKEKAIAALRSSEEQFRSIVETTTERIWATNIYGELTYNNPAVEKMLGYHPDELLGKHAWHFLHQEDKQRVQNMIAESISEKRGWINLVSRWRHKNGSYHYLESNSVPVFDAEGELIGYRGADRDITKRKLIEVELKANESRLAEAQHIAQIGSFEWSIPENIFICSAEFYRILRINPQNFGITLDDYTKYIHPDDFALVKQKIKEVLYENIFTPYEHRIVHSDGVIRDIYATAVVTTFDETGNPIKLTGIIHDITDRKSTRVALQESEYKLRTLFASMSEGLLQVDNRDCIQFVNNCFCEMIGYTEKELIGIDWLQLLFDEDREFIKQVNERRLQGISDRYEIRLRKKSGEILWMIVGGAPLINADGLITGSMGTFTDITERKRAEEQLLHDAFHDGLTGLPNRTLFMDHLQLTIERSKRKLDATFAILFLDLDRFKIINDSLGHTEGDNLLKQIAQRFSNSIRPGDLVARLGGDEFTILLSEMDHESDALIITERIQEDLKAPFNLSGREVFTSASIGIALSTTGHNKAEDMIRDADIAMYRAKAKGKSQYQVFDHEMHNHALKQLQMETEIRLGLDRGEFCINYQPIIKLETNVLVGFEALVRWNHPERGLVPPLDFIPLAEETGLIIPLGKWVLYESCRQLRKWQEQNSSAWSTSISVNLSCKQFLQTDLAEQVAAILKETDLAPSCLKLEITESHILDNTQAAIEIMNRLRALGVEISLDDFGTGYSSLSYLHSLPIDYLKIDRSFIKRMMDNKENAEIVNTIIKLARNLKMKVVAEGIETANQLDELKKLNCEFGQGYYFSKPLSAKTAALITSAKAEGMQKITNGVL